MMRAEKFPFGSRPKVLNLAQCYWELITPREREIERVIEKDILEIRSRGYLKRNEFLRLAKWKSPRPTHLHEQNSHAKIRSLMTKAVTAETDEEALMYLTVAPFKLAGVRLRTATALLHWLRPDKFPILDVRVVRALNLAEPQNWEDRHFYAVVAEKCRQHAHALNVDLRTLDRALWAWDKLNSNKSAACLGKSDSTSVLARRD
jgi:hypothetical protein